MGRHTLILSGGGPLGVAFEAGALICLEDALEAGIRDKFGGVIGASAGAVTGVYLCTGSSPARILRSMSGRFPEEIEYFDPFLLLQFDSHQVPSLIQTLWKSTHFLVQDWWRKRQSSENLERRKAIYDGYLQSIRSVIDLVPPGWFQADGLREFLRRTIPVAEGKRLSFDDLDRILLIKATDLGRGVEAICGPTRILERARENPLFRGCEILSEVDVVESVLYSSAIPFLFTTPELQTRYMADGEVRQAPGMKMAEHLLEADSIVILNPFTPLRDVQPHSPTSELFLQAILTMLEGNVTASLLLSGDGLSSGRTFDRKVPYLYAGPTPEQMARLTDRSIVNVFCYKPEMAAAGYTSMLRALESLPAQLAEEFAERGLDWKLARPRERALSLAQAEQDPRRIEDILLE